MGITHHNCRDQRLLADLFNLKQIILASFGSFFSISLLLSWRWWRS